MNRKAEGCFPPSYYELFDELQADMQHWAKDGTVSHEDSFGMHTMWDPRLLNAERDEYKESGASYRRRHQNRPMD